MEVRIRDVDPVILSKIDEMAKKRKQSRQVFLKGQIELIGTDYMQSAKVSHLEKQLQANTITLKEVAKVMNEMNGVIKSLLEE
ncbi:hypothetical protein SporoP8_07075 [Sporosarcina ureae]|uniref:hypothetical protein n=1 Tax=Sporosarcina ureae TaxID=1571 RepID=UPI000A15A64C|nr:hypothetical protein [Sporosarcina ureae]ARJ38652.1 hypothetical protein SporoP8_07075 [Sporosarcina ureae]